MKAFLLLLAFVALPAFSAPAISEFELPQMNSDPRGQIYKSADHKIPFLLEFYFNTCPACNSNASNVEEIAEEFHSDRVHVLDVGIDCRDSEYDSWISKHSPNHPVLKSCQGVLQDELRVRAYPTTVILDCHRTEVARFVGTWSNETKQRIRDILLELMFRVCEQ